MKRVATLLVIGVIYGTNAYASTPKKACMFSSNAPNRKEYMLCIGKIKQMRGDSSPSSLLMSPKDFSIVLDNAEAGNEGAQSLSFTIFDVTLNSHSIDVEYMDDTSKALSYSIEKNPISFLKLIPDDILAKRELLGKLCCSIRLKYSENLEYRRKHLKQRLIMIRKVKRPDLSSGKKIVEAVIREKLKIIDENIEYLKNSGTNGVRLH